MKTKSIRWAYPSSPRADEYKQPDGAYFVMTSRGAEVDQVHAGPFATIERAEQCAIDTLSAVKWSWMYRAYPLPGSCLENKRDVVTL